MTNSSRPNFQVRRECGYVLLTLLLMVSLVVIAAAAMVPGIARQMKRDREEELIHRGIEYRRAIHSFAKHTGQFPLSIDQLENTNGVRYLRKRYKDPMTGEDFRLLHMADIAATGARLATASPPPDENASPASSDQNASANSDAVSSAPVTGSEGITKQQGIASRSSLGSAVSQGGSDSGGGVIFGVVSRSSKQSIREFDHKNHYNQWLFFYSTIYDGSVDVKGPTPLKPVFSAQKSSADSPNSQTQPSLSQPQQ